MTTFRHSGKLGDIIYSLPSVKQHEPVEFYVNCSSPWKLTPAIARELLPLLELQPYIRSANIWGDEPFDVDLDYFQPYAEDQGRNLVDCHFAAVKEHLPDPKLEAGRSKALRGALSDEPWLELNPTDRKPSRPIVFARSLAHHGVEGFWETCMQLFGSLAVFVGTPEEHANFCARFGGIPFEPTVDLLDLARVINSADLFVGNQSCPYAIAEGLKKSSIQEVCRWCPNCIFDRTNALMVYEPSQLPSVAEFANNGFQRHSAVDLSFASIWRAHELTIEPDRPDAARANCPNFGQLLARHVAITREDRIHPHAVAERAHMFASTEGGAAEFEVLTFLNSLVYLTKPLHLLETGTGSGLTTLAMAAAVQANGVGHINTIDADSSATGRAQQNLAALGPGLERNISFHVGDSREFIVRWRGPQFDFIFFDSLIAFRHLEFQLLKDNGLLHPRALCAFHDTSRLRGEYYGDFNPEMIAALDSFGQGNQWLEFGQSRGLRVLKLGHPEALFR